MARPLRIQYANACYHVINRGDNRRPIFSRVEDYHFFLDKLSEYTETYNVEIYAYVLMTNHFHFYLCTPEANLTRFMQSLLTSYTMYRNKTEGTGGHVFQGRYKSIIVEHDRYAAELSRYIHLNPIRVQCYRNLSFKDKRNILRNCQWSSYSAMIGLNKRPVWLNQNSCYRKTGNLREQQKDYAEYVEEGLLKDIESPMDNTAAQSILGRDSFIDKIRRKYVIAKDKTECPQAKRLSSFMKLDTLVGEVVTYYQVDKEVLFTKFQKNNEARQMLLFLSKYYCRGRYSLSELAEKFGLSIHGLSANTYKFQKRINGDFNLRKRYDELKSILENTK
jgi:putative transposase